MRNINRIHWDITKKRLHNKISKEHYATLMRALDRYEEGEKVKEQEKALKEEVEETMSGLKSALEDVVKILQEIKEEEGVKDEKGATN